MNEAVDSQNAIEERNAAVQNLWLQCYTQQEIADSVGMPQKTVDDLLARIKEFKIPLIPGQFSEDLPGKIDGQ